MRAHNEMHCVIIATKAIYQNTNHFRNVSPAMFAKGRHEFDNVSVLSLPRLSKDNVSCCLGQFLSSFWSFWELTAAGEMKLGL